MDATSYQERQNAKRFYEETLFPRLNDKSNPRIIVIGQRLHEDDFAAHMMDKSFTHLNLRAIAEEDEEYRLSNGDIWRRARGEALFPEQEPLPVLDDIRREIGPRVFAAQYQQSPTAPDGNLLRWDKFPTYDVAPVRNELIGVVQSWDTAYSTEPTADFTVGMTFGQRRDGTWLLLDVCRQKETYPDLVRLVRAEQERWQADKVLIEYVGPGHSLFHDLRQDERWRRWLIAYEPDVNKLERFAAQTYKIEEGQLLRPINAPWLPVLKDELMAFPHGRYDDQVDALAQFLDWIGVGRKSLDLLTRRIIVRRDLIRRDIVRADIVRR